MLTLVLALVAAPIWTPPAATVAFQGKWECAEVCFAGKKATLETTVYDVAITVTGGKPTTIEIYSLPVSVRAGAEVRAARKAQLLGYRLELDQAGWLIGAAVETGKGRWQGGFLGNGPLYRMALVLWRQYCGALGLGDYEINRTVPNEVILEAATLHGSRLIQKDDWTAPDRQKLPLFRINESATTRWNQPVPLSMSWKGEWRLGADQRLEESSGVMQTRCGEGGADGLVYSLKRVPLTEAENWIAAQRQRR